MPMAASASAEIPNTVISHMLKRCRDIDRDDDLVHRPHIRDRQARRLAQRFLDLPVDRERVDRRCARPTRSA